MAHRLRSLCAGVQHREIALFGADAAMVRDGRQRMRARLCGGGGRGGRVWRRRRRRRRRW